MNEKRFYFLIGLFILVGISLLIAGIIILGGGKVFQKPLRMETYFDGSVQGLDVGSPVKYRGVKIGEVENIGTVSAAYPELVKKTDAFYTYGLYVMITMRLDPEAFPYLQEGADVDLERLIREKGLRIKFSYLGITGLAYLELDFVDPKNNIPLDIIWTPHTLYIPSVQNTIQLVSDSVNEISRTLTDDFVPLIKNLAAASSDLPKLRQDIDTLLRQVKILVEKLNIAAEGIPHTSAQLSDTLKQINAIADDARETLALFKDNPSQVIFSDPPPKRGIKR